MRVSMAGLVALLAGPPAWAQSSSIPSAAAESMEAPPEFTPSLTVHIAPTKLPPDTTDAEHDETTWSERGAGLKVLLAQLYDTDVSRVELTGIGEDAARYDVTLVLPHAESEEAIAHRIQEALEKKFHISVQVESRVQDVYVVTAPQGAGAGLKPDSTAGATNSQELVGNTTTGVGTPSNDDIAKAVETQKKTTGLSLSAITVTRGTIADLCRTLSRKVDRPFVDESHLTLRYDFELKDVRTRQQLLEQMQAQLGLAVQPAQRGLRYVVARPAQDAGEGSHTLGAGTSAP